VREWEWSDSERAFYRLGERLAPDVRTIEQMRPVLRDENATGPSEAYYMYRSAHLPQHVTLFQSNSLRYDVTVIPAAKYGSEFVKTVGHFHAKKGAHTYPEVYEVLDGEANYLLQDDSRVIVFEAKRGDKVVVPPDYGHVTINAGKKSLVMANIVSPDFSSDYSVFAEKRGAAFHCLDSGWAENPRYAGFSMAREAPGKDNCAFFTRAKTMYELFCGDQNLFSFLKEPEIFFRKG